MKVLNYLNLISECKTDVPCYNKPAAFEINEKQHTIEC